jgi:major membrane immunogen (membrane-anchored lipoprotein)
MLKTKVVSVVLGLTVAMGVLAGCSKAPATQTTTPPSSTTPATTTPAASSSKYVDGTYKVEYDNFDSHGYKGQLELTVKGDKITDVKYDEVMKDGSLKSKDEKYKKQMEEGSKTYPQKAYSELIQQLLSKQSASIDAVAGATASSTNFKTLVKYAFDKMLPSGKPTSAQVPMPK